MPGCSANGANKYLPGAHRHSLVERCRNGTCLSSQATVHWRSHRTASLLHLIAFDHLAFASAVCLTCRHGFELMHTKREGGSETRWWKTNANVRTKLCTTIDYNRIIIAELMAVITTELAECVTHCVLDQHC